MRGTIVNATLHELYVPQEGFQGMGDQQSAVKVICTMWTSSGVIGKGDGVFVSSWVKSINNYFGGMMLIFGLLEALEMEALVDVMDIDSEDYHGEEMGGLLKLFKEERNEGYMIYSWCRIREKEMVFDVRVE
ncbi:hypothetical protein Tco_0588438 [Tanacetum coccineum]